MKDNSPALLPGSKDRLAAIIEREEVVFIGGIGTVLGAGMSAIAPWWFGLAVGITVMIGTIVRVVLAVRRTIPKSSGGGHRD